jgi:DNA mismatch repair protein MutL
MGKIHLMSDALASQVAAGEVVERPASVVKELVENSIDAGAGRIEVLVHRGGISLIRVIDDGCGMNRDDALLSVERHATSKLLTKDDLGNIRTLGFRGEALPSIGSVSRFRLATREREALSGTEIVIEGGKLLEVRDSGEAPGTQVEVRGLFYNIPARRKFLRAEATEFSHVEQQVRVQAIAHPEIGFALMHGERLAFRLPPGQSLRERIEGLVGASVRGQLLEIPDIAREGVKVGGFISRPGFGRSNRALQYSFLNRRPVESPTIFHAVREAYRTALVTGQHPVTFLFLEVDPQAVDVNVHPAKKEVRFHDGRTVQRVVAEVLRDVISPPRSRPVERRPMELPPRSLSPSEDPLSGTRDAVSPVVSPRPATVAPKRSDQPSLPAISGTEAPAGGRQSDLEASVAKKGASSSAGGEFRLLGVLSGGYVLLESDEGLVIMDQGAAHERVLYEEARRQMAETGVVSQQLLIPLTFQLAPRDFDFILRHLPLLQKMGIGAEAFGTNTLKVDALPSFYKGADGTRFVHDVIGELQLNASGPQAGSLGSDAVATAVCRKAVAQEKPLHDAELAQLVRDLMACAMPYCDPIGRPTLIQMSRGELERKFGRGK